MSELSVQIVNRVKHARIVADAGRVHAPQVTAELGGDLDGLEGFEGSQLTTMAKAGVKLLMNVTELMEQLDLRYANESAQDSAARVKRDQYVAEGRAAIMAGRDHTRAVLGEEALTKYGIPSTTPEQANELLAVLNNIVHRLDEYPANEPGRFGAVFDSAKMREEFVAVHDNLAGALDALGTETRETEQVMLERDAVVARWERIYRGVAGQLSSLFIMAGRADLADRVRPTTRRAVGLDEPQVPVEPDTPDMPDTPAQPAADDVVVEPSEA
ncbi:hypothetical protein FIV42_01260 [Persicimonas caeni]|uniref:Uncharacterized protein n=1 Tax=Persicimonas caeni TaxID=2292766 RepID=A0A4Y6PMB3_PERCE|nr:hypothetical protein [Persicimonas caeni]QDG49412.1 hypothetical protein FIV42_01260 [Persicimonas caeni]QED30633.1 hypothetical protein FRD00_01255 [Persicimonas caeni]